MYRCLLALVASVAIAVPALAQTRSFPQNALRGTLVFGSPPVVALNGNATRLAPGARIPVKLYRRVCLVQTEDAILAEELLAHKKLAPEIVGRLTDRVLLVRPGRVDAVLQELQKMGHTPQRVEDRS